MLELKNIQKSFDGTPVLKDISIQVNDGEIISILGPSGCGKTTLLNLILGIIKADSGQILYDGEDLTEVSMEKRGFNIVFQDYALFPNLNVYKNITYGLKNRPDISSKEEVEELIDLLGLREHLNKNIEQLSGGQKQRVALARTMVMKPRILLLDEPTSYLDIKYKLEFLSVLQELQKKKGLTVILSLHELELAARVSDRILCVDGAFVEQVGTPEEIFRPGHLSKLFQITQGSFEEESQEMELAAVKGTPEVFVIAGNGSGRNTFRRLQREGIPFAAGLLWENDLDYPAAKALSSRLFSAPAFEPVSEELLEQAMRCMDGCRKVICCRESFGTLEDAQKRLLAYAKARGLSERDAQKYV